MITPSRQHRVFLLLAAIGLMSGCATNPDAADAEGTVGKATEAVAKTANKVIGTPIIPDAMITLGPSVSYPLEKLVYWGIWVGTAYLIIDPFAPNWEIQEAKLPENHIHFQLTMKRYYAGGAGEARVVLNRRARELMRAGGYSGFEIVEYHEGMQSSMVGSQRTAESVIRLLKSAG